MRSEIKFVLRNFLCRRRNYIADLDGKHRKRNLEVRIVWVGVGDAEEFFQRARDLFTRPRGPGAPLQHVAWEITTHPADQHGARRAFRDQEEMLRVARELVKQMHGVVALIGCHGLQDLHVLLLNDGPTGMGLKSYLPNRSNPRRVMVAVADRIEDEINEDRAASGYEQMTTMEENRAEERRRLGRAPLTEMLLDRVPADQEPDIAALLKALRSYGWKAKADRRKSKLTVCFKRGAKTYDLDLVHHALLKQWWTRSREREEKERKPVPPFEAITAAVHSWRTTAQIPEDLRIWVAINDGVPMATDRLSSAALIHATPECKEALSAIQAVRHLNGRAELLTAGNIEKPPYEMITQAIHSWMTTLRIPKALGMWVAVEGDLLVATDRLKKTVEAHPSPESHEVVSALSILRDIRDEARESEPERSIDAPER